MTSANAATRVLEDGATRHSVAASHLLQGLLLAPNVGTDAERRATFNMARRELVRALEAMDALEAEDKKRSKKS
jgi:hypothetical protein